MKIFPALLYSLLFFYAGPLFAHSLENKILISVIDTGIDLKNKEIKKHLWKNPGETGLDSQQKDKESNGIDDDHNGFVDDVHGWNFVDNSNDVQDYHGHGTHIVSIILDILKKTGFEQNIQIQVVKYYHTDDDTHNILKASNKSFAYAQQFSPFLVNYSGGGYAPSREEKQILEGFDKNKTLIIAASGNQKNNNDSSPYFPASYKLDNLIAVGSVSSARAPSKFTNYGKSSVNVFTQGEQVPAITLGNKIVKLSGTSQATAKLSAFAVYLHLEMGLQNPMELQDFFCSLTQQNRKLEAISSCGRMLLDEDITKFRGKNLSLFEQILSHNKTQL